MPLHHAGMHPPAFQCAAQHCENQTSCRRTTSLLRQTLPGWRYSMLHSTAMSCQLDTIPQYLSHLVRNLVNAHVTPHVRTTSWHTHDHETMQRYIHILISQPLLSMPTTYSAMMNINTRIPKHPSTAAWSEALPLYDHHHPQDTHTELPITEPKHPEYSDAIACLADWIQELELTFVQDDTSTCMLPPGRTKKPASGY